jgi:hypothetical protein
MSKLKGSYKGHMFHGSPERFEVVAELIHDTYGKNIHYIADVAGGRGMLTRILHKKYNYKAEVIDPRGWALRGVDSVKEEYSSQKASYYDLIVGLHPDEATREVAASALVRPTILIPCCNFWDPSKKLGRDALIQAIEEYYKANKISYKKVTFDFRSTTNIGLITTPAASVCHIKDHHLI